MLWVFVWFCQILLDFIRFLLCFVVFYWFLWIFVDFTRFYYIFIVLYRFFLFLICFSLFSLIFLCFLRSGSRPGVSGSCGGFGGDLWGRDSAPEAKYSPMDRHRFGHNYQLQEAIIYRRVLSRNRVPSDDRAWRGKNIGVAIGKYVAPIPPWVRQF